MKKLAAAISLGLVTGLASASAIEIQTGSFYESRLGSADAYLTDVSAHVGTPTSVSSYNDLGLSLSNSALESTITFDVTAGGDWDFRAGVDFGGGGALFLDGTAIAYNPNNMWWAGSYANADQYLAGGMNNLSVGVHTLTLYGFEDCCSGNTQVQFSVNGGQYTSFANTDGLPAVPEAQNYAMLLAGLGLVATIARRRKQA